MQDNLVAQQTPRVRAYSLEIGVMGQSPNRQQGLHWVMHPAPRRKLHDLGLGLRIGLGRGLGLGLGMLHSERQGRVVVVVTVPSVVLLVVLVGGYHGVS